MGKLSQDLISLLSASMRRMEEQIRILQEDLESEQHLRHRIEREKQELQMQIISISERLTEAESGSASQIDVNRKREAEMAKLRKLLEDVHTESEQVSVGIMNMWSNIIIGLSNFTRPSIL